MFGQLYAWAKAHPLWAAGAVAVLALLVGLAVDYLFFGGAHASAGGLAALVAAGAAHSAVKRQAAREELDALHKEAEADAEEAKALKVDVKPDVDVSGTPLADLIREENERGGP